MGTLETLAMCCVYVGFFIVFFTICAGINWILEKIGFVHWLRGWLWYYGIMEECPDIEQQQNNKNN